MSKTRNRLVIILIALLFFTPLLAAVLMQSDWWGYEPEEHVNFGQLIEPAVPLDWSSLSFGDTTGENPVARKWTLLYPLPGDCGSACIADVTQLRQIHIASGRYRDKVAVLLVSMDPLSPSLSEELQTIYPAFHFAVDTNGANRDPLSTISEAATQESTAKPGQSTTMIADPEGNLMLAYPPGHNPSELNKDLRKLLKWSGR